MTVDVVILAGARNKGPLKEVSLTEHEALIKIADIPMVEYVIKAVKKARYTDKVILVGPRNELKENLNEEVDQIIDSEETLINNIINGVKAVDQNKYILLITSDIPLITDGIIDDFIITCIQDDEADIYYPIIPKEKNLAKYPSVKRTYFHLQEGTFTGGNMVLINPFIISGAMEILEKAIRWRKNPWKLSRLLGVKFIFKFVIRHLSISEIEKRVTKITGYRGQCMITQHPEIGFDVDKPSDLELMREKYIL
ncbi:MAG: NTP transferase domain-containing protein [Halanaerobiales bacterium]|nr:NTP transferase domain-containing protein [Halanaerobiales bacterium]